MYSFKYVVGWIQRDFGSLGRPAEAIARNIPSVDRTAEVLFVEPAPNRKAALRQDPLGLLIGGRRSREGSGLTRLSLARYGAVPARLRVSPQALLINVGAGPPNVRYTEIYRRAPVKVLVLYDKVHLWPDRPTDWVDEHYQARRLLIQGSDVVIGLSEGAIDDIPEAVYLGHGCDDVWSSPTVDQLPEPDDLAAIPHPRALYLGALSVRIDVDRLWALADTGISIVLLGFAPSDRMKELISSMGNVHFLGQRAPEDSAAYMLHCDVGIVPHTDDPFTWSMEPHKIYNYAAAGMRSVALNCTPPRALADLTTRCQPDTFVDAVWSAAQQGHLTKDDRDRARSITWKQVTERLLAAVECRG